AQVSGQVSLSPPLRMIGSSGAHSTTANPYTRRPRPGKVTMLPHASRRTQDTRPTPQEPPMRRSCSASLVVLALTLVGRGVPAADPPDEKTAAVTKIPV